jgi:hypothetical protein
VNLFDGQLWIVAVVGVFVIALVAKWLRGAAVEDPHEEIPDADRAPVFADDEEEPVDDDDEAAAAEEGDEEEIDEDELAPLGVSPDDRLELLERLAARGAVALVWTPADSSRTPYFVQHDRAGDATTPVLTAMPVFTSAAKALAYGRAIGPRAMGTVATYEPMPVDAAFLVDGDFEVILNPRTPFETVLTAEDRKTLAALAGVEERPPDEDAMDDDELARLAGGDEGETSLKVP